MNIVISMKSLVLAEALMALLSADEDGHTVCICRGKADDCPAAADVIIIDSKCSDHDYRGRWPTSKLLLIDTGLSQETIASLLISCKLDGVLSTTADAQLLRKALRLVHEGQIWIDNENLKALLFKAGSLGKAESVDKISRREHQIIEQLTHGKSNKEIAALLFMSEQTVKCHVSRIYRKFNVSSRSQLISLLAHPA
jgi:DNA-binding NarL/FixJ family response regulator